MKPHTIKTGVMLDVARDSGRFTEKHDANFPNNLGKIGA